jgi:VanZ family protein
MKITGKWVNIFVYIIGIFIFTPYLPKLIKIASNLWSSSGVSRFVLYVEIAIAVFILSLTIIFLFYKRKKSALFLISIGVIFLLSFIIYQFIPNPYEFTHLPEYAILSILIIRALDKGKKSSFIKNSYFLSGLITAIIGTGDEVYQNFLPNRFFTWYDIFLNILGGILGLFIYREIKRY